MKKRNFIICMFLALLLISAGCQGGQPTKTANATPAAAASAAPAAAPTGTPAVTETATAAPVATQAVSSDTLVGNTPGNLTNGARAVDTGDFTLSDYSKSADTSSYFVTAGGAKKFFYNAGYRGVNAADGHVYYIDKDSKLKSMNLDGSGVFDYGIVCDEANVTGNWIYYSTYLDANYNNGGVYRMTKDSGKPETVIAGKVCNDILVNDGSIYYTDANNNFNLYKYVIATKESTLIAAMPCYSVNIADGYLYYSSYAESGVSATDGIYKVNLKDVKDSKRLYKTGAVSLNASNGSLYFATDNDSDYNLYKMDLATDTAQVLLQNARVRNISIVGDYLLFDNISAGDDNTSIVKNDGSGLTTLKN